MLLGIKFYVWLIKPVPKRGKVLKHDKDFLNIFILLSKSLVRSNVSEKSTILALGKSYTKKTYNQANLCNIDFRSRLYMKKIWLLKLVKFESFLQLSCFTIVLNVEVAKICRNI